MNSICVFFNNLTTHNILCEQVFIDERNRRIWVMATCITKIDQTDGPIITKSHDNNNLPSGQNDVISTLKQRQGLTLKQRCIL